MEISVAFGKRRVSRMGEVIKSIDTEYNGYKFRSRIEARWAVFFDAVGLKYEYEKEGYDLDGVWYLPDFWIPELDLFIEIKGTSLIEIEEKKIELLCKKSGKKVYLLSGQIPWSNDERMEINPSFGDFIMGWWDVFYDEQGSNFVMFNYDVGYGGWL